MAKKEIIVCDGCGFEVDKKASFDPFYKISFEVDKHTHIQRSVAGEKDLCSTCYEKLMNFLDTLGDKKDG